MGRAAYDAACPIVSILAASVTSFRAVPARKTCAFRSPGREARVRAVQSENAPSPSDVSPLGSTTSVRPQALNALVPIDVSADAEGTYVLSARSIGTNVPIVFKPGRERDARKGMQPEERKGFSLRRTVGSVSL
jgi:hypothetical protein